MSNEVIDIQIFKLFHIVVQSFLKRKGSVPWIFFIMFRLQPRGYVGGILMMASLILMELDLKKRPRSKS